MEQLTNRMKSADLKQSTKYFEANNSWNMRPVIAIFFSNLFHQMYNYIIIGTMHSGYRTHIYNMLTMNGGTDAWMNFNKKQK